MFVSFMWAMPAEWIYGSWWSENCTSANFVAMSCQWEFLISKNTQLSQWFNKNPLLIKMKVFQKLTRFLENKNKPWWGLVLGLHGGCFILSCFIFIIAVVTIIVSFTRGKKRDNQRILQHALSLCLSLSLSLTVSLRKKSSRQVTLLAVVSEMLSRHPTQQSSRRLRKGQQVAESGSPLTPTQQVTRNGSQKLCVSSWEILFCECDSVLNNSAVKTDTVKRRILQCKKEKAVEL